MEENKPTKSTIMQVINSTPAAQLPANPEIAWRFKKLFTMVHLGGDSKKPGAKQQIEAFYEAERFHFMKLLNENPELSACTNLSLYGCLMDVAVNRLSFDASYKHLYMIAYSHNSAPKGKPAVWEKRASLQISGYGELLLRIMQGQIKYADNPVLVYDGDIFKHGTKNQSSFIEHESHVPRKSDKIIACYMKITRTDNSIDYKVLTEADMERFRNYSEAKRTKKNQDGSITLKESTAWTYGIGGMWLTKTIKHAFKNYPKVRTGNFSELETSTVDTDELEDQVKENIGTMRVPDVLDYGIEETVIDVLHEEIKDQESQHEVDDDSFVQTKKEETITNKDDDAF